LRLQAGAAETPAERAKIRKEIGNILASKLDSYEDALDVFAVDRLPFEQERYDLLESVTA